MKRTIECRLEQVRLAIEEALNIPMIIKALTPLGHDRMAFSGTGDGRSGSGKPCKVQLRQEHAQQAKEQRDIALQDLLTWMKSS